MVTEAWRGFLAAAARERDRGQGRAPAEYPHYSEGGSWRCLPVERLSSSEGSTYDHGNWTAGFWFGVMWLLALGDGDHHAADLALERLPFVAPRAHDVTTHDLGFLFYPSYVLPAMSGLLPPSATGPAREAAITTARRFNARGDYIQAFGSIGDSRWAGTSTIDTMLNLPLLWWAAAQGADPTVFEIARRHARTSARLLVRADATTYHLNVFDPVSGAIVHRGTFQGAAADSCWSRGQAWALAGFAWAYAATAEAEFLEAAERTGDYFWSQLPSDDIPPWDFSVASADPAPDASAGAIAALGALLLGFVHPVAGRRHQFRERGEQLLCRLGPTCLNTDPERDGILLHSSYSKPHNLGVDAAVAWGDFYFGLALALAAGAIKLPQVLGFDPRTGA